MEIALDQLIWGIIVPTACLSSLLTALAVWWIVPRLYRRHLREDIQAAPEEIGRRVRSGLKEAAREMLPEFRDQVKEGFYEGLGKAYRNAPEMTTSALKSSLEYLDPLKIFDPPSSRKGRKKDQKGD